MHLVDIVPMHIEQAKERAAISAEAKPVEMKVGDALAMDYPDNFFDAAFLAGPLYHLIDRSSRVKAVKEAKRILKPGGILIAYKRRKRLLEIARLTEKQPELGPRTMIIAKKPVDD